VLIYTQELPAASGLFFLEKSQQNTAMARRDSANSSGAASNLGNRINFLPKKNRGEVEIPMDFEDTFLKMKRHPMERHFSHFDSISPILKRHALFFYKHIS